MRKLVMMMMMLMMMTSTACAGEYLDGEELFYNDVYNHENVDLVYDADYVKEYREAQKKPATNKRLVKQFCKEHYGNTKIKYVKNPSYKRITHRKGTVLVEIIKSKSKGRYGVTRNGCRIKYNKKVKKGKKVTSYCIYNPHNNYCDDVVAVVDNKKIR